MDQHEADVSKSNDVEQNKLLAALSYLWILCLIPLYLKKDSAFVQFHAKQGFFLFLISLGVWVLGWFPIIGWFFGSFGLLLLVGVSVFGFVKALRGEKWEIPLINILQKKS